VSKTAFGLLKMLMTDSIVIDSDDEIDWLEVIVDVVVLEDVNDELWLFVSDVVALCVSDVDILGD